MQLCFSPPARDADLLYASLFDLKLDDARLYGSDVVNARKTAEKLARKEVLRGGPEMEMVEKLLDEVKRLRGELSNRIGGEAVRLQKLQASHVIRELKLRNLLTEERGSIR